MSFNVILICQTSRNKRACIPSNFFLTVPKKGMSTNRQISLREAAYLIGKFTALINLHPLQPTRRDRTASFLQFSARVARRNFGAARRM